MKTRTLALLMTAGGLAIVAFAGAAVYVGNKMWKGISGWPSTAEEKRLVLDSATLQNHLDAKVDPACDRFHTMRNIDSSVHIEVTHQCEGDSIYFHGRAEIHRGVLEAKQSFAVSVTSMRAGLAIAGRGVELERRDGLLTAGEQRYSAIAMRNGEPVGNLFVVRHGRVVQTVILMGVYFDDPAAVRSLLGPMIDAAQKR